MNIYNKRTITKEEIDSAPVNISLIHYTNDTLIKLPDNIDDKKEIVIKQQIQQLYFIIVYQLSFLSKQLYKFQSGDESLKHYIEDGWKSAITTTLDGISFIFPEKFTQEFIDSKQGKRFKGKKPCAHMFMRALQSQKTIMEQLVVE